MNEADTIKREQIEYTAVELCKDTLIITKRYTEKGNIYYSFRPIHGNRRYITYFLNNNHFSIDNREYLIVSANNKPASKNNNNLISVVMSVLELI